MGDFGKASRRKIKRAEKHIYDLNLLRYEVSGTQTHTLTVEQDSDRINWLTLDFDASALPAPDAALVIGDILHNLRSALDILWHEVIKECGGGASKWKSPRSRPRDTRDALIAPLKGALEKKQITRLRNLRLCSRYYKTLRNWKLLPLGLGRFEH